MRRRRGSLWISLLLAVILTIGSLTGCRSTGSAQQPQENAAVLQTITEEEIPGNQGAQQDTQEDDGQEDGPGSGQETPDDAAAGQAAPEDDLPSIDEDGSYTTKEDVALYIHTYGKLPSNFITKKEAEKLGWDGGSLEPYAPGKCIGGNHFGNYEGLLPDGNYKECDIDTLGKKKRGAKRIIYSDDGRIYYTDDHYESFTQLY